MMVSYTVASGSDGGKDRTVWELRRGTAGVVDFSGTQYGYSGRNGEMVGMSVKYNSEGKAIVGPTVKLTAVEKVKASDFFERDGVYYVSKNGRTYQVAEDVECLQDRGGDRRNQDIWFNQATGVDRLKSCLAYSDNLTLYVDPIGQQVRIISAKQS